MTKKKNNKPEEHDPETPVNHNPADSGVDHSVSRGTEKDYDSSYIDKQEARGNRGEDNEDTTDDE